MKKLISCSVLLVILLFSSCKNNSTNPNNETKEIFPLKIGIYWMYNSYSYDSLGNEQGVQPNIQKVEKEFVWSGERIFKLSDSSDNSKYYLYYVNRQDGVYHLNNYFDSLDRTDSLKPIFIAKYPGKIGDSFVAENGTFKIEDTNYNYTISIGTFKCYKYVDSMDLGIENTITIEYFSPGVGFIGDEFYRQAKGGKKYLQFKTNLWNLV